MAVRDDTASTRRGGRRFVGVLLTLLLVQAVTVVADLGGMRRPSPIGGPALLWRERRTPGAVRDGPPIKPEHFRSVAELNKYLADLNEYYTVLGRPRFGKRAVDVDVDYDDGTLMNEARLLSRVPMAGRYRRDAVRRGYRAPSQHQQQQHHQRHNDA